MYAYSLPACVQYVLLFVPSSLAVLFSCQVSGGLCPKRSVVVFMHFFVGLTLLGLQSRFGDNREQTA